MKQAIIERIYLQRGYKQFPYLIKRAFRCVYHQFPLHREELRSLGLEGYFISETAVNQAGSYEAACKQFFKALWNFEKEKGNPLDLCLVLNSQEGLYLSKNGELGRSKIPWGGVLLATDGSVIQKEGAHYIEVFDANAQ